MILHIKSLEQSGAKKYAYRTMDGDVKITVSGVPKCGAVALDNDLNNFTDNLLFKFEDTGKNMLMYNDLQDIFTITDYQGNTEAIKQTTGACIVPATYELNKSYEYANFLDENSEERSIYKE